MKPITSKPKSRNISLKETGTPPPYFFQAEARGLELIRETETIHVPAVYHYDENEQGDAWLILEHIPAGTPSSLTTSRLGERLARMHSQGGESYGFDQPTFVGEILQKNSMGPSWVDYYRDERLLPQLRRAEADGKLQGDRRKRAFHLLDNLDKWIPENRGSSLLHGDLWGGNWIAGPGDTPYLIDPSVFYGDRLMDLSFTELFGGYPRNFYEAYQEHFPLPDYYEEVKPLYQLFYLLVHLNIFGESYGSAVDRVLRPYTSTKG
ncbi:Fructosamine-3-kinase [Salimicrobium flavidum]|uniref:Fructosamine-3-kinase n=1 Tax=Salimicrobium flavidum TaxID=570947 RepID=A0A1N7IV22_9BACI|nr:Fructosamine-3-kinase [Salimicrobium flavidum]